MFSSQGLQTLMKIDGLLLTGPLHYINQWPSIEDPVCGPVCSSFLWLADCMAKFGGLSNLLWLDPWVLNCLIPANLLSSPS